MNKQHQLKVKLCLSLWLEPVDITWGLVRPNFSQVWTRLEAFQQKKIQNYSSKEISTFKELIESNIEKKEEDEQPEDHHP